VARGTELEIVAKNAAGDWYQVCCVDGQQGWIVARLVEVTGDPNLVQVAANIPAPPTDTPVPTAAPTRPPQPTSPPAPTSPPVPTVPPPTPAPVFLFDKVAGQQPRPSTNPWITFYGLLFTANQLDAVGDHNLRVEGPGGPYEQPCASDVLTGGGPDDQSKFIFSCKVEVPGAPTGTYRVFPVDLSGNQVGEAYDLTAEGDLREFFPRWKLR